MERSVGSRELYRTPKKYMRAYEEQTKPSEESYATRDAVNIDEIRDMIDEAVKWRLHEETRPKTRQRARLYQSRADSGPGTLPFEVRLIILDLLQDRRDIWNMRTAFHGQWQWQIPDSYWRARFAGKDIIFEFEELRLREDLDWQYLRLKAEELLEYPCHGLRNRQRIMDALEGTKSVLLQMIDEKSNQERELGG